MLEETSKNFFEVETFLKVSIGFKCQVLKESYDFAHF